MHKTACTNLLPDITKGKTISSTKKLTFKEMHCQLTAFSFYGLLNKKEKKENDLRIDELSLQLFLNFD
jgi:hypothetical protein